MLKDIITIELQGANFKTVQKLPILSQDRKPVKASLVYGRNGSGKSTIAKAFRKLKGEESSSIQSVSVYNTDCVTVSLTEKEQTHIFVFDEDFVNENVRVQEDGLDSIVMLGEQVGLMDLIKNATTELQVAETDKIQKKEAADEFVNVASDKSPKYYIEKMKSALKGDNNWAGRDKIIKENAVNSPVSDNTYKTFLHLKPTKKRDELIVDFNVEMKKLKDALNGSFRITASIPAIPDCFNNFDIARGNNLLKKVIEHPELSEREQYLLKLVQRGESEALRITAQEFESSNLDRCPKCYQPLSEQYKKDIIANIQKVLSEDVKQHQSQLDSLQLPVLEIDLSPFQHLIHYQECISGVEEVNFIIQNNNALFNLKKADPYTPINKAGTNMADALTKLKHLLQQLEDDRNEYNQTLTDTSPIKANLTKINNEIAYYDVIEFSQKHEQQEIEKQKADKAYDVSLKLVTEKQNRLDELNAQRDSIHIAIDVINDGLKYIFFSANRMQIQLKDGVYKLLCNGQAVRPKDVSVGERNIIGLCYFFTNILQRKNKNFAYNEEYLLVIDDPVSSYDLENKIGILSYLKYQLGMFFLGNIETKSILLTHDLLTAIDIQKILDELIAECKVNFNGQRDFLYVSYELHKCHFDRFTNTRNEYTELLKLIYEYGNGKANEQGTYIGNIMLQVMEAFATFEYKKGIDSVSTDNTILAAMEREEDRIHYKNLMYRIVLNEGSHRYDQTRNMQMDFFAMISETDRRRTAKEILCFIYLLNKPHMIAHLGNEKCNKIETWCGEIRMQ